MARGLRARGRWLAGFLVVLAALGLGAGAPAQTPPPPPAPSQAEAAPAPAKAQDLLKLLDDPALRAWIKRSLEAETAKTPAAEGAPVENMMSDMADERLGRLKRHLAALAAAAPAFPGEVESAAARLSTEFADYGPLKLFTLFGVFMALGLGLEALLARWTKPIRQRLLRAGLTTPAERLRVSLVRFAYQLFDIAVFAAGSIGAFLAFEWPASVRALLLSYLIALLVTRISARLGRFLLAPGLERFRLIPMSEDAARFWQKRATLAVGLFAFGYMSVEAMAKLSFSPPARALVAYILGFGLLALAIETAWRRPPDEDSSLQPARHRRPWLAAGLLTLLWLLWVLGAMPAFWLILVLAGTPLALRLVDRSLRHMLRPAEGAAPDARDASIWGAVLERGMRAGVIVLAALLLAHVWDIDLIELTGRDTVGVRLLRGLLNAVVLIILADMLWRIGKIVIDRKIASGTGMAPPDTEEGRRQARLRTLLPIARNFLFAILLVVTLLMVLSSLGLDIGPLLAGAGIFGVAIGFGSQTLVRDIISGVFYLLDDAFRVGEYIQSGTYKGTVESFSLRSVKLRHHRGPLYTVPFGQLGAVQNMSRDWVIDKFIVSVTYDTDLDQVRKLIKTIGATLKDDPELGPHILETLKMQGVEQFGDYAIQIRLKMMTKPGEQFVIRRRAFALIKKAFDANGIKFAFPTVQVAGGGDSAPAAAAAQHEMIQLKAAADAPAG